MMDLLDAMSELVYVVDADTYDLLYMNASGKEIFGLQNLEGVKCYQAIQGLEAPCPFCTTPHLHADRYYTWERSNPITGRHYLLRDRLVDWPGRRARIQIAFDLTEKQEVLEKDSLLVDCVEALQLGGPFRESSGPVLKRLAEYACASRALIAETEDGRALHIFEWHAPDLAPLAQEFKGIDLSHAGWESLFGRGTRVLCDPPGAAPAPEMGRGTVVLLAGCSPAREEKLPPVLKALEVFITSVLHKERYRRQLERLSYIDSLTGALNYNAYIRDVRECREAPLSPVGIVHLSVNGLKDINDRQGREQGDRVLIRTAQVLQSCFPRARVYRMGGDEFIAIRQAAAPAEFDACVRTLREWREQTPDIRFALGYQWAGQCADLQALDTKAEERMYRDKKDFYRGAAMPKRYRPALDQALFLGGKKNLTLLLRTERFPVYFQPKFSVENRTIIGAEALVRFVSDTGEVLTPAHFIPFLEEARLVNHVDFHVFELVCQKIAGWLGRGVEVAPISVNFSRYSIMEPWFPDALLKSWERFPIPKEYVEIEITESAEEDDSCGLPNVLARLKKDGFHVSIDDFGVKYANLSLITNASFSTLKIDKSLIDDWKNPRTGELLRMLCSVCSSTGLKLIAEGVETQEQLEFLHEIHCGGVQGYLFSKPLPLEEYERLYLNGPVQAVN